MIKYKIKIKITVHLGYGQLEFLLDIFTFWESLWTSQLIGLAMIMGSNHLGSKTCSQLSLGQFLLLRISFLSYASLSLALTQALMPQFFCENHIHIKLMHWNLLQLGLVFQIVRERKRDRERCMLLQLKMKLKNKWKFLFLKWLLNFFFF